MTPFFMRKMKQKTLFFRQFHFIIECLGLEF
jgi:hypothetical protein